MKTSSVSFAQLRRLLLDLQFVEFRTNDYWRFEHPVSGVVMLFRPYTANDHVTVQDLASARMHLDWRGLLSGTMFDDSLTKFPAKAPGGVVRRQLIEAGTRISRRR